MEKKSVHVKFLVAFLLLLVHSPIAFAGPFGNWHPRSSPLVPGNTLLNIVYGNGIFVTVGAGGLILTSTDGLSWETRSTGIIEELRELAFGNGTFVVLGESGSILTSTDGETWTSTASLTRGASCVYSGIAFGNGMFVAAVTTSGTTLGTTCSSVLSLIYSSSDGITWTKSSRVNGSFLKSVAFGNGTFVANGSICGVGGYDDSGLILTSPDGIVWSQEISPRRDFVYYANDRFFAIGPQTTYESPREILQSMNGISWYPTDSLFHTISSVAFGNGTYVAVGEKMSISQDGLSWEENTSRPFAFLSGVAFGGSLFVAIGKYGSIFRSTDGTTWSVTDLGFTLNDDHLHQIASGDSLLVGVGDHGMVLTSQEGIQWVDRSPKRPEWHKEVQPSAIAFGNNVFVAVSNSRENIAVSTDGVDWSVVRYGSFSHIAFGNHIFVAMDPYHGIATSSDGFHWMRQVTWSYWINPISGLVFGNGLFVAVNEIGQIISSSDGVTWNPASTPRLSLQGISYGNGLFMAAGHRSSGLEGPSMGPWRVCSNGTAVLTSPDGISWTSQVLIDEFIGRLNSLTFGSGAFVSVWANDSQCHPFLDNYVTGGRSTIYVSPDGRDWNSASLNRNMRILGFGDGHFLGADIRGAILISPDGISWSEVYSSGFNDICWPIGCLGNGLFLLTTGGGTTFTSHDGSHWTTASQGLVTKDLKDVTYGNGNFVSVGTGGFIFASPDGTDWSEQQSGTTADLNAVTFGNGRWVAAGSQGTIIVSTDGRTWTGMPSGTTADLRGAAFGNNCFVVCGGSGIILSSGDGSTWTPADLDSDSPGAGSGITGDPFAFSAVAYGNGRFVSVGSSGAIVTSQDGRAWTVRSSQIDLDLTDIHFDRGIFVAVGNSLVSSQSIVMSSVDGITWSAEPMEVTPLRSVASVGDTFIVLGGADGKTIFQSDPVLGREWIPFLSVATSTGTLPVCQDGSFSSTGAEPLSFRIGVWCSTAAGTDADWWVLVDTPFGWFAYSHPGRWYPLFSLEDASPSYQGPIFPMESLPIPIPAALPAGRYTFYFGHDLFMNGTFDSSSLHYDHVTVEIGGANR